MSSKRNSKLKKRGPYNQKRGSNKNNSLFGRFIRYRRLPQLAFIAVFAGIGTYVIITTFATSDNSPPRPFVDVPERGLLWAGLKAPQAGSACGHLYELKNVHSQRPLCTHGPDPAPDYIDVRQKSEPIRTGESDLTDPAYASTVSTAASSFPCDGDGTSGNRVQGLYVRASDVPSRYSALASSLQIYASRADNQYMDSATQTNGTRHIRWVQDANCNPVIPEVVISPTGDDDFNNTINELSNLGYNRGDRKYMLWVDSNVYCGIGNVFDDDEASSANVNNGLYATYGRSDSGCWNYSEAHELMHNLGGVQHTAPHATPGWHCTDEADEMCYVDGPGVVMTNVCPYTNAQSILFDCNHDDYYYAGVPPAGNYLATHWNTANSSFLVGGGTVSTPVQCNNLLDDDADGKIDYPADPGCTSATDTSESPDPPPPADTTAPTVSITQPANDTIVKRSIGIYANSYDNVRVTKMEIYIDTALKTTSTSSSINYSWNAQKASVGTHTITVKAYDAANNVGQSSISVYKQR